MTHRSKRIQMKPVSVYMEAEGVQADLASSDQREVQLEGDTPGLVKTIKNIIMQEFSKIENEFHSFKTEVCNFLNSIEWTFGA